MYWTKWAVMTALVVGVSVGAAGSSPGAYAAAASRHSHVIQAGVVLGSIVPVAGAASASGTLQPTALGHGMCQAQAFRDGSVQAQIAVSNTTCAVATATLGPGADRAKGAPYIAGGFACKATVEGAGSPGASAWSGTYFAYNCAKGSAQAAFNWGRDYTYGSGGSGSTGSSGAGGLTFSKTGHHLLPTAPGHGMCSVQSFSDGTLEAQFAVYNTTCATATATLGPGADQAKGAPYHAGGFACTATPESAADGNFQANSMYYAYSCTDGGAQAAFDWGRG